jgi:hypothetical protein
MDASAFSHILLLRKGPSRANLLSILPEKKREAVETELMRMSDLSPEQIRESLKALRQTQAQRQREIAEGRIGRSLGHASPRLVAWLGQPFRNDQKRKDG